MIAVIFEVWPAEGERQHYLDIAASLETIVHEDHKEAMTRSEKRIATGKAAAPKGNRPKVQPD